MGKYYYGSFHGVSRDIFEWISNQPFVKEESITDRIVYELNRNNPFVACYEFKRNEEALNGADWEWWLILNAFNDNSKGMIAYRFRIQAKKLFQHGKNNTPLFHYANRNGYQIEQLIKKAEDKDAIPLYALYSSDACINEKLSFCGEPFTNLCCKCKNGIYLISAYEIFEKYLEESYRKAGTEDLLIHSLPFSIIDYLIRVLTVQRTYESIFDSNRRYYSDIYFDDWSNKCTFDYKRLKGEQAINTISMIFYGNCKSKKPYEYDKFPSYLKSLISLKEESGNFSFDVLKEYPEESIEGIPDDLCGLGVVDCRS